MGNQNLPDLNDGKPTRVRYLVLGVTFSMAFLLYLHRFCMSYAQRYVREDLGLTNDQLSLCFSAFFLSYALAQVPSGWMSDRMGARAMLTIYILTWSFFTAMMGWAAGFVSLLVIRLAAGLGQAGAYPTAAALIPHWVPDSQRGSASGFVAWGGRLGGGLAPVLTTSLIAFFVPLDSSPLLTRGAILNETRLQRQIDELGNSTPPQRDGEDALRNQKELQRMLALRLANDSGTLLERLNRLISSNTPLVTGDVPDVPLEREARKSLRQESLTPQETHRLNRLILEAAFPESIEKLYVRGWRPVMWTFGACGLFVAAAFWLGFRNRPSEHPWCNAQEQTLIRSGKPPEDEVRSSRRFERPPMKAILRSRSLWLMCLSQWGSNVGWVFLVTWLPRFLLEEHSVPLITRGWMCAIPLWVGWCGMLLGGRISDRMVERIGRRWGRIMPLATGRFLAMLAYLLCLFHPSAWGLTALFALVAFSTDLGSASTWAYKQDVGGHHVGSIHGWANMWGNLGATLSPLILNALVNEAGWDAAFLACAGSFFVAGLATLGVDATIPIGNENSHAKE